MPRYRALAHNRDFTALWVGQTVAELGTRIGLFVFPLLAYALTGSTPVAALSEAVHLLGMVLTLLPAGVLADAVHRGRVMRWSAGSGALLHLSLVVAGLLGALTVPHLLVVALLTGVGAGLFAPAEISAVRSVVDTEDLPTALSQNQARIHVASLAGGPLGGVLYAATAWLPFAANTLGHAVSWLMLGRIRTDLSAPSRCAGEARPRPLHDAVAGLRFLWRSPFFRTLTAWAALANLAINALFFAAVLELIRLRYAAWQIGLVEAAAGLCGLVGALVAPWLIERVPTGRLTVAVAWSFVPLATPMVLWTNPAVVAAALGAGLLLNPAGNAGITSYRIAVTPPDLLGRVQSGSQFASMAAMPLAPIAAGGLLAGVGGPAALGLLTAFCAVVALVPTLSRTVRSVPRPAQWQTGPGPEAAGPQAADEKTGGVAPNPGPISGPTPPVFAAGPSDPPVFS